MRQDSDASGLATRVAEFKSDPDKLRQASEFVDQLIQQAKKEAELKQKEKDRNIFESQDQGVDTDEQNYPQADDRSSPLPKSTCDSSDSDEHAHVQSDGRWSPSRDECDTTGNLKRRFGRARGFVLRMFDALCNCTQTAAAAARTTARTNNPFNKR